MSVYTWSANGRESGIYIIQDPWKNPNGCPKSNRFFPEPCPLSPQNSVKIHLSRLEIFCSQEMITHTHNDTHGTEYRSSCTPARCVADDDDDDNFDDYGDISMMISYFGWFGRLLQVHWIKPASMSVRLSVYMYVRAYICPSTKSFSDSKEIWYVP